MVRKTKKTFVKDTSKASKKVRHMETSGTSKSNSRQHVSCNCNLCKGRKVDPRTKESHMKERELLIRRESSNLVVEESANQINVPDDSMDIDINYISGLDNENDESGSEQELQKFNFLVTKPKKRNHGGRSRINFPIVVIEQYYSDEDRDVNEDINFSGEDEDDDGSPGQHIDFNAPESGYEDKDSNVHNADINQRFL